MEGPPLGPGGEDITWPDQVAPRGRKASSTRKIKPQTSNLPTICRIRGNRVGQRSDFIPWPAFFDKQANVCDHSKKQLPSCTRRTGCRKCHAYFSLRLPHRIYHGAKGAMLVYDVTNKQSFDNIPKSLNELVSHVSPSTVIMLIGVP